MINVLIHHEVDDYPAWKLSFESAFDWRRKNGERSYRLFHNAVNFNELTLLFEWESLESARSFLTSDELKARMAQAGVKGEPKIEFLSELHNVRRSAAD